jgi:hypothetical protein
MFAGSYKTLLERDITALEPRKVAKGCGVIRI